MACRIEDKQKSASTLPHNSKRKRYSLVELLRGVKLKNMRALNKKTEWAREGKAVGRERV